MWWNFSRQQVRGTCFLFIWLVYVYLDICALSHCTVLYALVALYCMRWSHLIVCALTHCIVCALSHLIVCSGRTWFYHSCSTSVWAPVWFQLISHFVPCNHRLEIFFLDINDLEHILEEGNVPNQPADDKGMFNMFLYITFPFSEPLWSFSVLANVPDPVVEILPDEQNDQLAQQPQQLLPFEDISDEGQSIIVLFSVMSSHNITHFCFCRTRQRSSPGCGKPSRRAEWGTGPAFHSWASLHSSSITTCSGKKPQLIHTCQILMIVSYYYQLIKNNCQTFFIFLAVELFLAGIEDLVPEQENVEDPPM